MRWEYCTLTWHSGAVGREHEQELLDEGFGPAIFGSQEELQAMQAVALRTAYGLAAQQPSMSASEKEEMVRKAVSDNVAAKASWGHLTVHRPDKEQHTVRVEGFDEALARLGADSWEMCAYQESSSGALMHTHIVFKRPLDPLARL